MPRERGTGAGGWFRRRAGHSNSTLRAFVATERFTRAHTWQAGASKKQSDACQHIKRRTPTFKGAVGLEATHVGTTSKDGCVHTRRQCGTQTRHKPNQESNLVAAHGGSLCSQQVWGSASGHPLRAAGGGAAGSGSLAVYDRAESASAPAVRSKAARQQGPRSRPASLGRAVADSASARQHHAKDVLALRVERTRAGLSRNETDLRLQKSRKQQPGSSIWPCWLTEPEQSPPPGASGLAASAAHALLAAHLLILLPCLRSSSVGQRHSDHS